MKLGLIGCGRMGGALIAGAIRSGITTPENLLLSSRTTDSATQLAQSTGGKVAANHAEVIQHSDLVLLGCKPHQVVTILEEINTQLPGNTAIVSVAAGITLQTMENACPDGTRILRAMPNTPCMIGKGATGITAGTHATESDKENTRALMESVGTAVITTESQLDAVTGLSGSGPAYIYTMIKALTNQGIAEGLHHKDALNLATQTVLGAAEMVKATGKSPQELIDQVTSPGGTTLAGLKTLADGGFDQLVADCVHAATERSREIAKGN